MFSLGQSISIYKYPNGDVYKGKLFNNQKKGLGTYTWADGTKFEGIFSNDSLQYGTMTWPDGECYQGEFDNGRQHGKGKYSWPGGHVFEGVFKNDQRVNGKMTFKQSQPISVRKLKKTLQRVRNGKYVIEVSNVMYVRNLIIIYTIFQYTIQINFTVILYSIIVIKLIQMNKFIQLKHQTLVKTIKYNILLYLFYNYILSFYVKFKRYRQNIVQQMFKLLLDIILCIYKFYKYFKYFK
ncbi:ankyrin_repeat and MYND domain-containing protein [Hexamita inflata]|uniref:Ankyrin repeat and MYND domain-containing protein n=1 Tax=Hexamita inflata TaxID=28002 RepID=A0AA86P707_9EUKA|nr:ankyrin repeat and MYND domain-containing protein [Hexamita inflata]